MRSAWLVCLLLAGAANGHRSLSLSSLDASCHIELLATPSSAWDLRSAFLNCRGQRFLIVSPQNFYGKVNIKTEAQALEYVRLFSGAESYRYFDLGGMVELFPGKVDENADFNVVHEELFSTVLVRPSVKRARDSSRTTVFVIQRTVVFLDQSVCEVTEEVGQDGSYHLANKRILITDAAKIGNAHLGDI
jgi:hypothetical protein